GGWGGGGRLGGGGRGGGRRAGGGGGPGGGRRAGWGAAGRLGGGGPCRTWETSPASDDVSEVRQRLRRPARRAGVRLTAGCCRASEGPGAAPCAAPGAARGSGPGGSGAAR